jgi:hypothetical protein
MSIAPTAVFGEFPSAGTLLADFIIAVGVITAAKQESTRVGPTGPVQRDVAMTAR